MNIAEIQFALDKHGLKLIDKLENGELLVREKTPQEKMRHKDGIEEEDFYRAWNAGQVTRVKDVPPATQREWVGLTEEDFSAINLSCLTKFQAVMSAESILKERNHG
jgi:hypothetical protein